MDQQEGKSRLRTEATQTDSRLNKHMRHKTVTII